MAHHTKDKGDIAVTQAIADLTKKEYTILTPTVSEHLPFDFIAYKNGQCFRIQAKYRANGNISNTTVWNDKNGNHKKEYGANDFDYYAIYLPEVDTVVYPNISFGGASIRSTDPKSATPFYWYKDFLSLTDTADKKNYRDFGIDLNIVRPITEKVIAARLKSRKAVRPSKEELTKLLWEKPMTELSKQFGVSDVAIGKWAKAYGIEKPPVGHWVKK